MLAATQLHPPRLGPQFPIWPGLIEMVRPYAQSVGHNVYPAYLGQTVAGNFPPVLRDRVPVYLWAPNGETLDKQWYGARLVSSYLGLPLYATWCCGNGPPFPSGSSSSGSSLTPSGPADLVIGVPSGPTTFTAGVPTTTTYTGVFTSAPPDTPFTGTITGGNIIGPGGPGAPVKLTITGGPDNPFGYSFTGPLTFPVPGLYTLTFTIVTATGQVGTVLLKIVVVAASGTSSRSSSSSGFGEIVDTCCGCLVVPTTYRVSLAPVLDNTCVTCADYNTVNVLHYEGLGFCQWSTQDTASCGGSDPTWLLSCDGVNWILQAVGVAGQFNAKYLLPVASWSCLGANTLAFDSSDTTACTFPASATVTPI